MGLSLQLFSAREQSDLVATLRLIKDMGYHHVEGWAGAFGEDPGGFRQTLDQIGLTMPTVHLGVDRLQADPGAMIETAQVLGASTIFAPYLPPEDRPTNSQQWQAFASTLASIGNTVTAAGLGFGWHNHDFEFVDLGDGVTPMEIILNHAPKIEWEADLAWVVRGGQDPKNWINRYGQRITAVHLKDIAPTGEKLDEDGWADPGTGIVGWDTLLPLVGDKTRTKILIAEHDKPSDFNRFAQQAIDYYRATQG